jgi:hypothetical protein
VTTFDSSSEYQFTTDLARSYFVAIECAEMIGRKVFLIYCSYNWKYFFYDIELEGIATLNLYLSDPNKTTISFHLVEVLACLNKYGKFTGVIHDLHTFYCINKSVEKAPLLNIITDVVDKNNSKSLDFYYFAMPLYKELFLALHNPVSKNDKMLLEYKRTQRLYSIFALSYYMSAIYNNSEERLKQQGYRQFNFNFDWSLIFNKPGVLYSISLPNINVSNGIASDSFTMDICLLFISIPHLHKQRSRIISINDNELIVYYEGNTDDSRRFYNLLMNGTRRAYARKYDDELSSSTYCVVYSHL